MKKLTLFLCALALVFGVVGNANSTLIDRGGGLIYDSDLEITWLQDTNYAMTSGFDSDGKMLPDDAKAWAENLIYYDSVRDVTWTDWRLPQTLPINPPDYDYSLSYIGASDRGWNITSLNSEMSYLYYISLGNDGRYDPLGKYTGSVITNVGPFVNLSGDWYWSGTPYEPRPNDLGWAFYFGHGYQDRDNAGTHSFAWAVRDGDVGLAPEPSIAVTSPNGGEELSAAETFEITWESEGDIEYVKIEYSVNDEADWIEIVASTENDGSYDWEVPCENSENGLVSISDISGNPFDVSDAVFSIFCLPVPDIKANGQDDPISVIPTENINITVSLNPGGLEGEWFDWWIGVISSYGNFPFIGQPIPLFELPEITILDSPLPTGLWLFYFILDDNPNGIFDSMTWYDYVMVISSAEASEHRTEALPNFDSIFQEKIDEIMRE